MMDAELKDQLRSEGLESMGLFYSVYRGTVQDNNDPKNMGRLVVSCQAIYGDELHEYWAFPRGMVAGNGTGIFWVPSVGDMVFVSCEGGNPRFPMWEYAYPLEGKQPSGATIKKKVFLTPAGQRIELDEENDSIDITSNSGFHVKVKTDGIYIGKEDLNLAKFLDDLFNLFQQTKVATSLGPQGFINVLQYQELQAKITQFLKDQV